MEATELRGGHDSHNTPLPIADRDRSDGFFVRRKPDSAPKVLHTSFLPSQQLHAVGRAIGVSGLRNIRSCAPPTRHPTV